MTAKRISVFEELKQVDTLIDLQREPQKVVERLPFTVRIVQSEEDLMKAVRVRYEAYAKHTPEYAEALKEPEEDDFQPDVAVMLAESKLDGSGLGTARVHINNLRPLKLEQQIRMPSHLLNQRLSSAGRLAIRGAAGGLVRTVMFKSLFIYWETNLVDWAVVAARPPVHRLYERLLFNDIHGGQPFMPPSGENQVPHYAMALEIRNLHSIWTAANHPLATFFFDTNHPDINVKIARNLGDPRMPVRAQQPSVTNSVRARQQSFGNLPI